MTVVVRYRSHRARHAIDGICGKDNVKAMFLLEDFYKSKSGRYLEIPAQCAEAVRGVKGVTLARIPEGNRLLHCWG